MFPFFLLVLISLISGLYITYKFKLELFFSERIFYGFTIAISAFTQLIYLIALLSGGLKLIPNITSLVLISALGAYSLFDLYKIRDKVKNDFNDSIKNLKSNYLLPITLLFWSFVFNFLFHKHFYLNADGIHSRASTDMPVHMAFITSFVWGNNFPHDTPLYTGEKLVYPFLSDFLSSYFVSMGMNVIHAFNYPGILMCIVLTGIMYFFSLRITKSQKLSVLSVFLLYLGGGWGFYQFFDQDLPSKGYSFYKALSEIRDLYTDLHKSNIQFYNFIIAYLLPQRSFLFGFPLALTTLSLVWIYKPQPHENKDILDSNSNNINDDKIDLLENPNYNNALTKNGLLLAGITAGITPLFHYHSFMCVVIIVCCWFFLFFQKDKNYFKNYLYFFVPMTVLALPQVLMATGRISKGGNETFKIHLGWMAKDQNYLWFWLKNTGFTFLLLLDVLLSKRISKDIKKMYLPYLLLFLLANVISFSPCWIGDNAKVIFYWFIASIPLIALSLANLYKNSKFIAIAIFITLILSSTLDITKYFISNINIYRVWGVDQIKIAKEIINKTDPKSKFLTAPIHYTPIYLTGRSVLAGNGVHICTQAINATSRQSDINIVFTSVDDSLRLEAIKRLDPDYALIGKPELERMKDKTFFKRYFQEYIKVGEESVYKIKN